MGGACWLLLFLGYRYTGYHWPYAPSSESYVGGDEPYTLNWENETVRCRATVRGLYTNFTCVDRYMYDEPTVGAQHGSPLTPASPIDILSSGLLRFHL